MGASFSFDGVYTPKPKIVGQYDRGLIHSHVIKFNTSKLLFLSTTRANSQVTLRLFTIIAFIQFNFFRFLYYF